MQTVFSRGYVNCPITPRWAGFFQQEETTLSCGGQHHFSKNWHGALRWCRDAHILQRSPGRSWFLQLFPEAWRCTEPEDELPLATPGRSWRLHSSCAIHRSGQDLPVPQEPKELQSNRPGFKFWPLIYNFGNFIQILWGFQMEMATLLRSFGTQMRRLIDTKFRQMAELKDWQVSLQQQKLLLWELLLLLSSQ